MSEQQASTAQVLEALDRLENKLSGEIDGVRKTFEQFRESLPDVYMPRRELQATLDAMREKQGDTAIRVAHADERISALQQQLDQARIASTQEANAARNDAKDATNTVRAQLDSRTISQYAGWLIALVTFLLYMASYHVTFH